MSVIYQPNTGLRAILERRAARLMRKRVLTSKLDRPIVSFSFDDCPRSALENAAPILEGNGWRGTFYMAMGLCETTNHLGLHMSEADVKAAHKSGHEIADHTFDHIDGQQITPQNFIDNIDKNQAALAALDIPPSRNFAYPYGCVSPTLKTAIAQKFELVRGVHNPKTGSANAALDTALLPSMRMYSGEAINDIIRAVELLEGAPQWLTIFTHDVREAPSDYGCTPDDMERIIRPIKDSGALVMPMIEALDYIESGNDCVGGRDV